MSPERRSDSEGPVLGAQVKLLRERLCDAPVGAWMHPCPYLPGRISFQIGTDCTDAMSAWDYQVLLEHNFRRSGPLVYTVGCDGCVECRSLRVRADEFQPSRTQRRCWRRNADLSIRTFDRHVATPERLFLYRRYVRERHGDAERLVAMTGSADEFVSFLCVTGGNEDGLARCVEFRNGSHLVAVGVYDELPEAYSAVYCYFDPDEARRSPGTFNILWLLEQARRTGRRYVYLGYYVAQCRKMNYKARFRPCELWTPGKGWLPLERAAVAEGEAGQERDYGADGQATAASGPAQ